MHGEKFPSPAGALNSEAMAKDQKFDSSQTDGNGSNGSGAVRNVPSGDLVSSTSLGRPMLRKRSSCSLVSLNQDGEGPSLHQSQGSPSALEIRELFYLVGLGGGR